jgi:hypothetical protein
MNIVDYNMFLEGGSSRAYCFREGESILKLDIKVNFFPFNQISSQITIKSAEEVKKEKLVHYVVSPYTSEIEENIVFQLNAPTEPINSLNATIY